MSGDKTRQFRKPADVLGGSLVRRKLPAAGDVFHERFIVNVCCCDTDDPRPAHSRGGLPRLANAAYLLSLTRFAPHDANQRDRRWGFGGCRRSMTEQERDQIGKMWRDGYDSSRIR